MIVSLSQSYTIILLFIMIIIFCCYCFSTCLCARDTHTAHAAHGRRPPRARSTGRRGLPPDRPRGYTHTSWRRARARAHTNTHTRSSHYYTLHQLSVATFREYHLSSPLTHSCASVLVVRSRPAKNSKPRVVFSVWHRRRRLRIRFSLIFNLFFFIYILVTIKFEHLNYSRYLF